MPDLPQFIYNAYNAMGAVILGVLSWLYIDRNKRIETKISGLEKSKLDQAIYNIQKDLPNPIEKKIEKIETYLKLLLDKEGINYHQ